MSDAINSQKLNTNIVVVRITGASITHQNVSVDYQQRLDNDGSFSHLHNRC